MKMKRGKALVNLVVNQGEDMNYTPTKTDGTLIKRNKINETRAEDNIPSTSSSIIDCHGFIHDGAELLTFKKGLREIDIMGYDQVNKVYSNSHFSSDYVPPDSSGHSTETFHTSDLKDAQNELCGIATPESDLLTPSDLGILKDVGINSSIELDISVGNDTPDSPVRSSDTGTSQTESPQSSPTSSKRQYPLKTDPGRKRKRNPSLWKQNMIKKMKNTGQEYTNNKGKHFSRKTMKPGCGENCFRKCQTLISDDIRKSLFDKFWEIGHHEKQMFYLSQCVKRVDKKVEVVKKEGKSRRQGTYHYFLRKPVNECNDEIPTGQFKSSDVASDVQLIRVCKKTFLATFDISDIWVTTLFRKIDSETYNKFSDLRGKHNVRPHRIQEEKKEYVRQHIKSMPVKESHYVRKTTSRLFFDEGLNLAKLYRLYVEWMKVSVSEPCKPLATLEQYRAVFNSEFNIGFFQPKKDQCLLCHGKSAEESEMKSELLAFHRANTYCARVFKDMDKERSSKEVVVACYDMQKILATPQSEVSIFYYKRKFAVYNFTIFSIGKSEGHCYLWNETIGKKGPNEISSALINFIEEEVRRGASEFVFYSDCCGGQNRNRVIFAVYSYACSKFNISITHRFFEVGHSQSEGDSMHALIERRKKNKTIYVPAQWVTLIESAKVTGKPYKVTELQQKDILDYKNQITKFPNLGLKALDENNKKVMWSKIVMLQITKDDPYTLEFQYDYYSENTQKINFNKRPLLNPMKRRPRRKLDINFQPHPETIADAVAWSDITFDPAYRKPLPITLAKYKDLNSLCASGAIPGPYREFYKNLPNDKDAEDNNDYSED